MRSFPAVRIGLFALVSALALVTRSAAADALPPPPALGLGSLVQQLAQAQPPSDHSDKAALLRPEFQFKPQPGWVFLPEIARQLTSNPNERSAVQTLLEKGTAQTQQLLAAEGAGNDVLVATTFFLTQLWTVARQQEVSEQGIDAFHAQLVASLPADTRAAISRLSDADKQKYWEYCVGLPVFVIAIKDIAKETAAQQNVRQFAGAAFATLFGASPEKVTFSDQGIQVDGGNAAAKASEVRPAAAASVTASPAATSGPSVRLRYTPPEGWARENAGWATIFRGNLLDADSRGQIDRRSNGRHAATILVLQPRDRNPDAAVGFAAIWKEQLDGFDLGNTFPHYRTRLKSGLVVDYMGRFLHRKVHNDQDLRTYAVMYLVELGGGKVQPVIGILAPSNPDMGMLEFKEQAAFRGFAVPLLPFLDSIEPDGGPAPTPAGAMFQPSEMMGNWTTGSSTYGGSYVNANTGASAGIAYHTSGGNFLIGRDGRYEYDFAFASSSPVTGGQRGLTKHSGTYRIDGDTVVISPQQDIGYKFNFCTVGIGVIETPQGRKRMLMGVGADSSGIFHAPSTLPNWDSYTGTMTWYNEK
jgi:hypothetical protein